jgi:pyrroloquinoline quinone biosynthesis protein D
MSIEISGKSIVQLPTGVRLKEDKVRERMVLLAPERAVVVDPIAVAILGEIDGSKTLDDIVGALAAKYAADPELIKADVIKFLLDLSDRRMLEIEP